MLAFYMKTSAALMMFVLGATGLHTLAASAEEQPKEIYFEAVVKKAGVVVGAPHLLARLGSPAKVVFAPQPDPDGEGFLTLKVETTRRQDAGVDVRLSALVDDKEVAVRSAQVTATRGARFDFDGGAYTWSVEADLFTKAFVERKKSERKKR
jgi:hypothetical protein